MSNLEGKSPSPFCTAGARRKISFRGFAAQLKGLRLAVVLLAGWTLAIPAEAQLYAGALGGVATLSGDAHSSLGGNSTAFSSYDPRNGAAVEVVLGRHLSNYLTIQADYIWNRNGLTLTSAALNDGVQDGYPEARHSSQQSVIGDLLVYFRGRDSRLRPYLAEGTGLVHLASSQEQIEQVLGSPNLPPRSFRANVITLHVPVGIDVGPGKGWAFRYTFNENLSKNPISDRLSPPGQHKLMNFQNLFGFVKRF